MFAGNKVNVTQKLKFALGKIENIVGKGENDSYQHLLLFPQCFQKATIVRVVKSRVGVGSGKEIRVNLYNTL